MNWTREKVIEFAEALELKTSQDGFWLKIWRPVETNSRARIAYNCLASMIGPDRITQLGHCIAVRYDETIGNSKSEIKKIQTDDIVEINLILEEALLHGLNFADPIWTGSNKVVFEVSKEWNNVDHVLPFSKLTKALERAAVDFDYLPIANEPVCTIRIICKFFGMKKK